MSKPNCLKKNIFTEESTNKTHPGQKHASERKRINKRKKWGVLVMEAKKLKIKVVDLQIEKLKKSASLMKKHSKVINLYNIEHIPRLARIRDYHNDNYDY